MPAGITVAAIRPATVKPGARYYEWCEYYGIQGRRVLSGDECGGLVKLLPIDWGGLFGE